MLHWHSFLKGCEQKRINHTIEYLDELHSERREKVIKWVISYARKRRNFTRMQDVQIRKETSLRETKKWQNKDVKERKAFERRIRDLSTEEAFPRSIQPIEHNLILGNVVGRSLSHVWYDEDGLDKVVYSGKFEKLKRSKTYVMAYWKQNETYDDAEDFELTKYELGADIVCVGGGGGGPCILS